jgi:hypothetical protein
VAYCGAPGIDYVPISISVEYASSHRTAEEADEFKKGINIGRLRLPPSL